LSEPGCALQATPSCARPFPPQRDGRRLAPRPREWHQLRNCQLCGEPFIVGSGNQRFCTPGHARKHTQLFGSPSVLDGYRERALDLEAELAKLRDELATAHGRRAA